MGPTGIGADRDPDHRRGSIVVVASTPCRRLVVQRLPSLSWPIVMPRHRHSVDV
jgi:hypothetical protein